MSVSTAPLRSAMKGGPAAVSGISTAPRRYFTSSYHPSLASTSPIGFTNSNADSNTCREYSYRRPSIPPTTRSNTHLNTSRIPPSTFSRAPTSAFRDPLSGRIPKSPRTRLVYPPLTRTQTGVTASLPSQNTWTRASTRNCPPGRRCPYKIPPTRHSTTVIPGRPRIPKSILPGWDSSNIDKDTAPAVTQSTQGTDPHTQSRGLLASIYYYLTGFSTPTSAPNATSPPTKPSTHFSPTSKAPQSITNRTHGSPSVKLTTQTTSRIPGGILKNTTSYPNTPKYDNPTTSQSFLSSLRSAFTSKAGRLEALNKDWYSRYGNSTRTKPTLTFTSPELDDRAATNIWRKEKYLNPTLSAYTEAPTPKVHQLFRLGTAISHATNLSRKAGEAYLKSTLGTLKYTTYMTRAELMDQSNLPYRARLLYPSWSAAQSAYQRGETRERPDGANPEWKSFLRFYRATENMRKDNVVLVDDKDSAVSWDEGDSLESVLATFEEEAKSVRTPSDRGHARAKRRS